MSPRVLFEQDLETLKNKVSEMGEHAEISYDHMLYGIRENKEDILKTLLDTDHKMVDMQRSIEAMCLIADQTTAGGKRYAAGECGIKGCNRY